MDKKTDFFFCYSLIKKKRFSFLFFWVWNQKRFVGLKIEGKWIMGVEEIGRRMI